MRDKKPLWWRIMLRLTEADMAIGYIPSQFVFYLSEELLPSRRDASYYKRKLFAHAIIDAIVFSLLLVILRRVYAWNWRVMPSILAVYLPAIAFFHYSHDSDIATLTKDRPEKRKELILQLRIVKLMVVVWAIFVFTIQTLLP